MKLLVENKKNISINKYCFRAFWKQFQLVTSILGSTRTDQTVEKYVRATFIIIVSTECNIVTIKKLK